MLIARVQWKGSRLTVVVLKQLECFQEYLERKLNGNVVKMAKIPYKTTSFFRKSYPMLYWEVKGMNKRVLWMYPNGLDGRISISS